MPLSGSSPSPHLDEELARAHALVAAHLEGPVAAEEYVQTVEYDPELRRWYVRFTCDARDATTIYFDLHQRTLRYEVYFLPIPPEHLEDLYEVLLRANHSMYGARFSLGPDGDIYLVGRVALEHLDTDELDRIIGVLYELTDRWFQPVVRIAYPRPRPTAS
ncbi:MAG: YbjN domain-containing protein [Acidimicrobiia bacterium]